MQTINQNFLEVLILGKGIENHMWLIEWLKCQVHIYLVASFFLSFFHNDLSFLSIYVIISIKWLSKL